MADEVTERITILLQAKDRDFARAMDRNNKVIAKLAKEADKNTSAMTKRIDANLSQIGSKVGSFGKAFVGGLAVGLITTALSSISGGVATVVADLSAMAEAARRSGIDVETFQGLQGGLVLAGVSAEESTKAIEKFTLGVGEAAEGQGALYDALRKNGVAIKDVAGNIRPTMDIMRDFADVVERSGSAQERLALVNDAFGRSGRKMVEAMSGGSTALDAMVQGARDAGLVMDAELIAKAEELDNKFDLLGMRVSNFFKGVIVEGADFLIGPNTAADILIGKFGDLEKAKAALGESPVDTLLSTDDVETAQAVGEAYDDLTLSSNAAADALAGDADAIVQSLVEMAAALRNEGEQGASDMFMQAANDIGVLVDAYRSGEMEADEFTKKLSDTSKAALDAGHQIEQIDGIGFSGVFEGLAGLVSRLGAVYDAAVTAKSGVMALAGMDAPVPGALAREGEDGRGVYGLGGSLLAPGSSKRPPPKPFELGVPDLKKGGGGGGGGASADEYQREAESIAEKTRALEAEAAALILTAGSNKALGDAIEFAKNRAQLMVAAQKEGKELTPELIAEIDAMAMAYDAAGVAAEEAAEKMKAVQDAVKDGAANVTEMFMSIFDGSKSAGEALGDFLTKLALMKAEATLMQALMNIGQSGGVMGKVLGFLGGGASAPAASAAPPAYAGGTNYHRGGPARVNENGGEIIDLPKGSRVIPHDVSMAAAKASGGGKVTVNVINNAGARITQSETTGPNGERTLTMMIEGAVKGLINGGRLDQEMAASFGARRRPR